MGFELLEKEFGEWIGNPNCVAVSSGTSALHIACEVMKLERPRDLRPNVVVPEFTMVACARAVTLADLNPVFLDCREDLNISPEEFRSSKLNSCGIMPVHIYGRRCRMDEINLIARSRDMFVIEDLAEAHGVMPHKDTDAACWSFYKNKIIHGEEGGMIAFKNPENVEKAKSLRSLGFTKTHDFNHIPRGINARMSNLHAEPIIKSLRSVSASLKHRRRITGVYDLHVPTEWKMPDRDVDWVYDLRIPNLKPHEQSMIVRDCRRFGIEARHGFKTMSSQVEYSRFGGGPLASLLSQEIIYLPHRENLMPTEARDNMKSLCSIVSAVLS